RLAPHRMQIGDRGAFWDVDVDARPHEPDRRLTDPAWNPGRQGSAIHGLEVVEMIFEASVQPRPFGDRRGDGDQSLGLAEALSEIPRLLQGVPGALVAAPRLDLSQHPQRPDGDHRRSEEHTSELQSL